MIKILYHTTLSLGEDERQERWFFIKLGVPIILEKLMMLHEFGDFIILEKANNLNTCC
jgi:hypothetical protein